MTRRCVTAAWAVLTVLACATGWLALRGSCSYAWRALQDTDQDMDWGQVRAGVQGRPACQTGGRHKAAWRQMGAAQVLGSGASRQVVPLWLVKWKGSGGGDCAKW